MGGYDDSFMWFDIVFWAVFAGAIWFVAFPRDTRRYIRSFVMSKWANVLAAEAAKRKSLQDQNDALTAQVASLQSQVNAQQVQVTSLATANNALQTQVDTLIASAPDAQDEAELAAEEQALNVDDSGSAIPAPVDVPPTGTTTPIDSSGTPAA